MKNFFYRFVTHPGDCGTLSLRYKHEQFSAFRYYFIIQLNPQFLGNNKQIIIKKPNPARGKHTFSRPPRRNKTQQRKKIPRTISNMRQGGGYRGGNRRGYDNGGQSGGRRGYGGAGYGGQNGRGQVQRGQGYPERDYSEQGYPEQGYSEQDYNEQDYNERNSDRGQIQRGQPPNTRSFEFPQAPAIDALIQQGINNTTRAACQSLLKGIPRERNGSYGVVEFPWLKQELDRPKYINKSSGLGTQVDLYFVTYQYYRTHLRRHRDQTRRGLRRCRLRYSWRSWRGWTVGSLMVVGMKLRGVSMEATRFQERSRGLVLL